MDRPAFGEVPELWEIEGSLRDIYILKTTVIDWVNFLDFAQAYPLTYSFDGMQTKLPSVEHLLRNRDGSHLLRIALGTATANCHFFAESEIELDLDPREIQEAKAHEEVLSFIKGLADAVGKSALLTPENCEDAPYISYEPRAGIWHVYS